LDVLSILMDGCGEHGSICPLTPFRLSRGPLTSNASMRVTRISASGVNMDAKNAGSPPEVANASIGVLHSIGPMNFGDVSDCWALNKNAQHKKRY